MKLEMSTVNVERGSDRRMLRICRMLPKQELTSRVTCVFIIMSLSRYTPGRELRRPALPGQGRPRDDPEVVDDDDVVGRAIKIPS